MTIHIDILHGILALIGINAVLCSIFNKIRYDCIKQASSMVASAEKYKDLTGEEKFKMVISWIDESLPKIFRNSFVKRFSEYVVQYTYDKSVEYTRNYIKRKTGYDVTEIIEKMKLEESENIEK